MNKSGQNFRRFLIAGLLSTCLLGGLAIWLATGDALKRLQEQSLQSRADEITETISRRIGEQVNGLEYLARRPRIIGALLGDETQIDNVRDIVRTFDLYDDLEDIELFDFLGELVLSERFALGVRKKFTPEEHLFAGLVERVLATDGNPRPFVTHTHMGGESHIIAAIPVHRNKGIEGVLVGTFHLDLAVFQSLDEQLIDLSINGPFQDAKGTVDETLVTSSVVPAYELTIDYLWSLDLVREERQIMVLMVASSLICALVLAFGCLAWIGQRIILEPQRELEASRMALTQSEAKARELAAIAENTQDPIAINDLEGRLQWGNRALFEVYGFSEEEMLGQPTGPMLSGHKTDMEGFREAYRTHSSYTAEVVNYTRDGREIDILLSVQPVQDQGGDVTGFVAIGRNITDLKQREAELEEARARADAARSDATATKQQLEEAINALDDGFVFYDADDRLVTFNGAYQRLMGAMGSNLQTGKTYEELLRDLVAKGIVKGIEGSEEAFIQNLLVQRQTPAGVDKTFQADNRRWIHQRDKRTASGAMAGLRVDITELKQREEELEIARQRAEDANHAKSNFLANMSHEIRTPMNGIIGMCELLSETELNEDQRLWARTINSSSEALLTIINNILDFSKIEAGKQEILQEPFSLHDVVYDVARLLHTKAHEKGIEICVDYDDQIGETFIGDVGRVRQILINLTGNAVKFTEDGYVLLQIGPDTVDPGSLSFSVKDTGIGIPKHKLNSIFQAFEQVDNESTRQHDGTGLGLAISRGLVVNMGGDIEVTSQEDLGSEFRFSLPLKPANEPVQSPVENWTPDWSADTLAGKTVLVVDDLSVNRYIMTKRLARVGAETVSIADPEEALDMVLGVHDSPGSMIDLAILDHHMPGMDGETLLVAMSGSSGTPPFPTILCSSMDYSIDSKRLSNLGFAGVVLKPVSTDSLSRAVHKALGGHATAPTERRGPRAATDDVATLLGRSPEDPLRVMAAEDNRTNQLVLQKMLAAFPIELEIFSNGQEILHGYMDRGADLIFMDVSMPVMGGLEATQAIRAHEAETGQQHCPIIALTAKAMKHHEVECRDAGMDGFLTKPIKKAALAEALVSFAPKGQDLPQQRRA
ncbi:MAG: response regulator [Pseudomonadota bacterium]